VHAAGDKGPWSAALGPYPNILWAEGLTSSAASQLDGQLCVSMIHTLRSEGTASAS
jgi:hypothetical protein